MAARDLVEHYKLNVKIHEDYIIEISNSRKEQTERKWLRSKFLGQGGFGLVWLIRNADNSGQRAVKQVPKTTSRGSDIDICKELLAMAKFSRVSSKFGL